MYAVRRGDWATALPDAFRASCRAARAHFPTLGMSLPKRILAWRRHVSPTSSRPRPQATPSRRIEANFSEKCQYEQGSDAGANESDGGEVEGG